MPHTKAIENGLFELRVKSKEGIARVFFCIKIGKEIKIAKSRMSEVKENLITTKAQVSIISIVGAHSCAQKMLENLTIFRLREWAPTLNTGKKLSFGGNHERK